MPDLRLPWQPRRILVIRLSAIGDVILSSGLIPVLKAAWPEATVDWLTESANQDLLRCNPQLGRVHLLPRRRWSDHWKARRYRELFREVRAFVRELRQARYDLVLDIQGLMKSALLARAAGGRMRIGLGSKEGSGIFMSRVLSRHVDSHRPGKEYRALCEALGLDVSRYALDVPLCGESPAEAERLLAEAGIAGPFVVFAPFTTRPQKHWFDEHWRQLAAELGAATGWPIVMLGGPADQPHGHRIRAGMERPVVDLVGRTSLQACAALIRRAGLLVGVDTGLTHLGLAMDTPTLALFGSTRPYLETGLPATRVLYEPMSCSPCRRRPTCAGAYTCMRAHDPGKVAQAALALLEEAQGASAP